MTPVNDPPVVSIPIADVNVPKNSANILSTWPTPSTDVDLDTLDADHHRKHSAQFVTPSLNGNQLHWPMPPT
ncbi:MAG: hypothetical protein R3C28_26385 [Pirellulaceae bacterium]